MVPSAHFEQELYNYILIIIVNATGTIEELYYSQRVKLTAKFPQYYKYLSSIISTSY